LTNIPGSDLFILFNCCCIVHVTPAFIWATPPSYMHPSHYYIHNILRKLLLSYFSHFSRRETEKKRNVSSIKINGTTVTDLNGTRAPPE